MKPGASVCGDVSVGVGEGTGVVWGRVLNNSFDNHSAVPFLGNPGTVSGEKQSKKVIMYRQTTDKTYKKMN